MFFIKLDLVAIVIVEILLGGETMTRYESYPDYQCCYEYHGNTSVEITRKQDGITIERDWILFDSVEEAQEFFYDDCNINGGYYVQ